MGSRGTGRLDFPETGSQSQCSRRPPLHTHTHPTLGGQGTCVKASKSLCTLLSLPQEPPAGYPARANGSSPLKDLKRPQASATYLNPHPARTPIPVGTGVPGWTRGRRGSLLLLPLPASHWTYNSGTEPCSHCPPNPVSSKPGDKHREPGTPQPKFGKERKAGLRASSGSALHSPLRPFILLSFPFSLHLACLCL